MKRAIGILKAAFNVARTAFLIFKSVIMDTIVPVIVDTVIPALQSLWAVLLANPIVLVVAAIAALVAAFIWAWNNIDGFKEFWINLWENIKTIASNAIDSLKNFFTQTVPQ